MSFRPVCHRLARTAVLTLALSFGTGAALAQTAPSRAPAVKMESAEGEYVTLGRVNLRQQPSQQGARVGQIDAGVKVRVTGRVADAPWFAVVAPDGRTGYVFADLLRAEAPAPVAASGATPAVSPASSAAAEAVGDALTRRLDAMEAALNSIRDQLKTPTETTKAMADRQQALETAIEGLRADIAGLRGAAAEGDKPGGLIDRLLKLQDQVSAQVNEQKAEMQKLAQRLDRTEEWLKPLGDWSEETWGKVQRKSVGWGEWLWTSLTGTVNWLTGGWLGSWWPQEPAPPAVAPPAAPAAPPTSTPGQAPQTGRTIMGELVRA